MEYLTLQDIPHRHYDSLHSRRMTSSHSTERTVVNMAAAVSNDPQATSHSFPSSSPHPGSVQLQPAMSSLPAGWRLEGNKRPWAPTPIQPFAHPPPLKHIQLPLLSDSTMQRTAREETPQWADPVGETSGPPAPAHSYAHNDHGEPSQSTSTNITLTDTQNHHMRHSPPIQPGEQNFPAKLPSFSEFLNTTRASTPPRTPSRRHGSANSSPQTQPQPHPQPHPHFDDVAWAEGKRRRVDTLGDIYVRQPVAMEQPPMDSRRMSNAIEHRSAHYDAVRVAQHEEAQPSGSMHHHRPSNSYPPPPHPSFASSAHLRHQSSPPVSQGNIIYPPQPPRHSIAAHAPYPASVPHGGAYEQRPGYYQDSQRSQSMYPYERSHDAYYHQPPYPGPGFDSAYGDNIRFQQHVGLDQSAFNRKRRGNLPKEATNVLKEWYSNHRASPYPTEDQKLELCSQTGLSLNQVSNWFINARRRAPHKEQREREANNPGA